MSTQGSSRTATTNHSTSNSGPTPNRSGPSYEETVVHGKKRKVWRSSHSTTTSSGSSNVGQRMTPEAAANYLQQAAEAAAAAAAGGDAVQITLGPHGIATTTTTTNGGGGGDSTLPWMTPHALASSTTTTTTTSTASQNRSVNVSLNLHSNNNSSTLSFGGLDLAALAPDLSALTAAARNVAVSGGGLGITTSNTTNTASTSIAHTADAATIDASIARKLAPAGTAHLPTGPSHHNNNHSVLAGATGGVSNGSTTASSTGKDASLPCSEAEMKALMSMFVEIMGMSMNTEKLGPVKKTTAAQTKHKKNKPPSTKTTNSVSSLEEDTTDQPKTFSSGSPMGSDGAVGFTTWADPALAVATGDVDALQALQSYADNDDFDDDDEYESDSLPDLDEMEDVRKQQPQAAGSGNSNNDHPTKSDSVKSGAALLPTNPNPAPITGRAGIAPVEWESLEQVAIEDAMEAEERARKAAKRREKKHRKKEQARQEAAALAAEEAAKKQEKKILAWRSRVVSACQSNEVETLTTLLEESPLTLLAGSNHHQQNPTPINGNGMSTAAGIIDADVAPIMTVATMTPHLEFLLPHIVAKNRASAERKSPTRTALAHFVMNTYLPVVFTVPLRTGRTAFHTACWHGDLDFVQHAVLLARVWLAQQEQQQAELQAEQDQLWAALPSNFLSLTCQESGFAPIHYAVISGVRPILECLLEAGADVKLKSSDTHTWKSSTGKGISPRELAETVSHGSQDKVLETHGLALQEAIHHYSSSSEEKKKYRAILERMRDRLKDVEQNGYSPPPPEPEVMNIVPDEPKVVVNKVPSPEEVTENADDDDNDNDSEEPDVTELMPQQDEGDNKATTRRKKKKKRKKKGQQADTSSDNEKQAPSGDGKTSATAATAAPDSGTSSSAQDPLVVALLGMGFTEEQIQAAVKACGGTDRATADDLVVWILSEGASDEAAPAPAPPVQPRVDVDIRKPPPAPKPAPVPAPKIAPAPAPQQSVVPNKPKPKEMSPAVEEARARETKAAAQREEETRLKEQRLAAKREEKMRRNREWNEKAQARQKEEEKAKIAQAVADANRVANERATQAAMIQQQQHLHQQAQQHARMAQAHAQQHAPHNMMGQQAPNFFPGGPHVGGPGLMGPPNMGMPPPPPGHYGMGMPLPPSGYGGSGRHTPQSTSGNMLDAANRMVEAQQAAQAHARAQAYDNTYNQQLPPHPHPPPGMQKMAPQVPQHGWEPSSSQGHNNMYNNADMSSHYSNIPDDSTISSYGSGRVSVPSNFSATLPPGFRQNATTSSLPPPMEESASVTSYEENPLGEMRATAREFVPSFSSRPSSRGASSTQGPPPPPAAAEPAKKSRLPALAVADRPPAPTNPSGLPPTGLIGGVSTPFGSSLLSPIPPPGSDLTSSLIGVSTEHFSPVAPSTAATQHQLPKGLGLDKGVSSGTGTTDELATLTAGLASTRFENGSALWGGGIGPRSPAVAAPTDASTGVAGIPMTGLSSLALPTGDSTKSGTTRIGPRSDSLSGEALLPSALGGPSTWGAANLSGNAAGTGGGSIW